MRYWKLLGGAAIALALGCSETTDPIAPPGAQSVKPSMNTSVTGAAFTTTNTSATAGDGTGHCKNGNEDVNCNIYDGKQYVWLNGGPSVAYVGDGTYFFAVISPGGQPGPNDGASKNLSDDFDAYTDRTFSVSGGTVSYSGPHDFDSNKIRLMPYADTPNPGGVYILAICSLADGYPVDPSDCKYDAFKVQAPGEQTEADAPTISKDAAGSNKLTFTWGISKDVDHTRFEQIGGSITANYTVSVTHNSGVVSEVKVTGTITVFNPNVDDIAGANVTDVLSDNTVCTVTSGSNVTLGFGDNTFAYSCDLGSSLPSGQLDNKATVTWSDQTLSGGLPLTGGSADFTFSSISFTETKVDDQVSVTDTYKGTLGTVTSADASPKKFTYSRTIGVLSGCHDYDNTATFTTNTSGTTGNASQTVTVCGPTPTGALTMGFWKGPNGNSLIQNYCRPSGKTYLAVYLQGLGAGAGPFANAPNTTNCNDLVTWANAIFKAASATNMNNMIKPQMLATALDVYFSSPSLGYTTAVIPAGSKNKPPSNFLTKGPIGPFVMDLTAICPMVDNLSTGSATCTGGKPSTNAHTAGAVPWDSKSIQGILDYAATVGSGGSIPPWLVGAFSGTAASSTWYGTDRTKQEILKNIFDQINNDLAFKAP